MHTVAFDSAVSGARVPERSVGPRSHAHPADKGDAPISPRHAHIDAEVLEALTAYQALVGDEGLSGIADPELRRQTFLESSPGVADLPNDLQFAACAADSAVNGNRAVPLRVYCPKDQPSRGLIYFIHGGGMVLPVTAGHDPAALRLASRLRCTVAAVDYRVAPENPYPIPLRDCYAGLDWVVTQHTRFGLDPAPRPIVYGESSGGGLAAGLCLLIRDEAPFEVSHAALIYPMLDDSDSQPSTQHVRVAGAWTRRANAQAWRWYLGDLVPGSADVPAYAAPFRATDLTGFPPTFVEVGQLDIFRDEVVHFSSRLMADDVPVDLSVHSGAVHGSERMAPKSRLAERIWDTRLAHLDDALSAGIW